MKRLFAALFTAAFAAVLAAPSAFAADDSKEFIEKAVRGNIAEVQLGELAEKKGKSEQVQALGESLQTDHTKALERSEGIAKDMGLNVTREPTKDAKQTYDRLAKLSGAEFDKAFIKAAIEDHENDIELYSKQAKESDNKKVAEYAEVTLPALKKHLDMARKLQGNQGN